MALKLIENGVFSTKVCRGTRVDVIVGENGHVIVKYKKMLIPTQLDLTKTSLLEVDYGTVFTMVPTPNPGFVIDKKPEKSTFTIDGTALKLEYTFKQAVAQPKVDLDICPTCGSTKAQRSRI